MKIFHKRTILNYITFFYKIFIFLILFSLCKVYAAEEKIGVVTEIQGSAIAINTKGDERELNIFDSVFLNDELFVAERSFLTVQYNDSTTIMLKELTSFSVNDFDVKQRSFLSAINEKNSRSN